jgi:hypothetical protein
MKYLFLILLFPSVCYALFTAQEAASQVAKIKNREQNLKDRELSSTVYNDIEEAISIGSCSTSVDTGNVSEKANNAEVKKLKNLGYAVKSSRTKIDQYYYGTLEIRWCEDK